MRRRLLVMAASLALTSSASAGTMTFDNYWSEAIHKPDATVKEYPDTTVVEDKKDLTIYIFTKPNNPAHPGVIVRKLITDNSGSHFDTEGHSYGPASSQPTFKAWMANPLK